METTSLTAGFDLARQLPALLPYLVLAVGGLLVLLVDAFVKSLRKDHLYMLTLLVLLGAVVAVAKVAIRALSPRTRE